MVTVRIICLNHLSITPVSASNLRPLDLASLSRTRRLPGDVPVGGVPRTSPLDVLSARRFATLLSSPPAAPSRSAASIPECERFVPHCDLGGNDRRLALVSYSRALNLDLVAGFDLRFLIVDKPSRSEVHGERLPFGLDHGVNTVGPTSDRCEPVNRYDNSADSLDGLWIVQPLVRRSRTPGAALPLAAALGTRVS